MLPLVCVTVFVDAMLFAAIIPLIPRLTDDLALSTLEAGLLVGAYGAGAVAAGIPSGHLAQRIGPKRTVVVGLLVLALSTAAFALVDTAVTLSLARLAQGVASAISWSGALAWLTLTTPRERRGQTLGTAYGIAVLGFIVGPAIGALADVTSVEGVFLAVALVAAAVSVLASWQPGVQHGTERGAPLRHALRRPRFLLAVWLTVVPAIYFGALDLLAPLSLDDAGWGSVAIAAAFVCAGLVEVTLAPVAGRISDRRGRLVPARAGLWGLVVLACGLSLVDQAFVLVVLLLCSAVVVSGISTPGMALVSDEAEASGLSQALGFGAMNSAWAFGAMIGPVGAGALADGLGDAAPYAVCAALAAGTAVALRPLLAVQERPA